MVRLIEKDDRVFLFIQEFIQSAGYSPTVREIMTGTSLPSGSALASLRKLKRAGVISFQDGCPRTITIIRYSIVDTKKVA